MIVSISSDLKKKNIEEQDLLVESERFHWKKSASGGADRRTDDHDPVVHGEGPTNHSLVEIKYHNLESNDARIGFANDGLGDELPGVRCSKTEAPL